VAVGLVAGSTVNFVIAAHIESQNATGDFDFTVTADNAVSWISGHCVFVAEGEDIKQTSRIIEAIDTEYNVTLGAGVPEHMQCNFTVAINAASVSTVALEWAQNTTEGDHPTCLHKGSTMRVSDVSRMIR